MNTNWIKQPLFVYGGILVVSFAIGLVSGFFVLQKIIPQPPISQNREIIDQKKELQTDNVTSTPKFSLQTYRWDLYGEVVKIDKKKEEITIFEYVLPKKLPGKITVSQKGLIFSTDRKMIFIHGVEKANEHFITERGSLNNIKIGSFIHRIIYRNPVISDDPLIELRYSEKIPFTFKK